MMIRSPIRAVARGFSLIEMLVSIVISLVLALAVTTLLINSEGAKRTITSLSDVEQGGSYLTFMLDRTLRSGGSGFAQYPLAVGCSLQAAHSGSTILPRQATLPAPFAGVPLDFRLAPVVIAKDASGGGSDVLIVMAGTSGFGSNAQRAVANSATDDSIQLPNTQGIRASDLVLVMQDGVGCMLQQVASTFNDGTDHSGGLVTLLPFAGDYHQTTIGSISLTDFGNTWGAASGGSGAADYAYTLVLGNAAKNPPQFQLLGVGDDAVLWSLDLLDTLGADARVPLAEGVVEMRALYGMDTTPTADGKIDAWVDPGTAPYDIATLMDGSTTSMENLGRIVAIRVGLILRTSLQEREEVASELTLFNDLDDDLHHTYTVPSASNHYRHRTMEVTVPLRNRLWELP